MDDRWVLIGSSNERELYRWEKQTPDGEWAIMFRGKTYLDLPNGIRKETPEGPFFKDEAEGRIWLAGN